jgi:hypothetical protein
MAASPEQVPVVAAAAAAAVDAVLLQPPPYTDGDDITRGVACYGCKDYTGHSWHKLFQHMKKKHGLKMSDIHGTFFYKKSREEMNALERNRIQKGPVAVAAAAPVGDQPLPSSSDGDIAARKRAPPPGQQPEGKRCRTAEAVVKREAYEPDPADPAVRLQDGEVLRTPDGGFWRAMWVLYEARGVPSNPPTVQEIDKWEFTTSDPAQWEAVKAVKAVEPPVNVEGPQTPVKVQAVNTEEPPVKVEGPQTPVKLQMAENPLAGLLEQLAHVLTPEKGSAPSTGEVGRAPRVRVKIARDALEWTSASLAADSRRHSWPLAPREDFTMDIAEFGNFLANRSMSDDTAKIHKQGAEYFVRLLDFDGSPGWVSLLASMFDENLVNAIIQLPLMDSAYSWTRKIVDSMDLLCEMCILASGENLYSPYLHPCQPGTPDRRCGQPDCPPPLWGGPGWQG